MADDSLDATAVPSDIPAAIAFLRIFSPNGPWRVYSISPSGGAVTARTFSDEDQLRQYLTAASGKFNLYHCPNPLAGHIQTTPTKFQVSGIHSLYCDLDLPPHQAQSIENFQSLLDRINMLTPPPTMIVATGGGLQAYWFLQKPIHRVDQDDIISRAEAAGRDIAAALSADAVQNSNRLLRIPGTVNVPTPTKIAKGRQPALAKLLHFNDQQRWSFDDPIPHPHAALPPPDEQTNTDAHGSNHTIDDLSKKWQHRIKTGDTSEYDNDKSRLVAAIIRHLLNLNWTPDEIIPFLSDSKYGASAHCRAHWPNDPVGGARRQIERVIALAQKNFKANRFGTILPDDPHNIALACHRLGVEFRYNEFDQRIYCYTRQDGLELVDDAKMEVIAHEIYKQFHFLPGQRAFQRFVTASSREYQFHPLREHLALLQTRWEQKQQPVRLTSHWLIQLASAPDTPLVRTISQLIAVAAVRRIRSPGCKFDEMLVLQGVEGTNKSSALERLAIQPEFFTDNFPLHEKSSQRVQERLRGKWIVECSELAGYADADNEHFKAMLSRTNDSVRQAYGRLPTDAPRQCVFFGSTNEAQFLQNNSNRRIWPVPVGQFDIDALEAILDDFWGEAAHLEANGLSIRLDPALWPDASEQQRAFRLKDPWTDELVTKLGDLEGFISAVDAFKLLGSNMAATRVTNANRRLTAAMTDPDLGFTQKRKRVNGGPLTSGYERGNESLVIYVFLDDVTMKTFKASHTAEEEVPDF